MPPKVRRPAAKVAVRRRGAVRRPAAPTVAGADGVLRGDPGGLGPGAEAQFDVAGFERGAEFEAYKVPLRLWKSGRTGRASGSCSKSRGGDTRWIFKRRRSKEEKEEVRKEEEGEGEGSREQTLEGFVREDGIGPRPKFCERSS